MTHEQKIKYMKSAMGICGFGFTEKDLDLVVSIYDLIVEKKGDTDLQSICKIQVDVTDRHLAKERSALLDKFSEKK